MRKKPIVFTVAYLTLLFACAAWILLDQFVIVRKIAPVQPLENISATQLPDDASEALQTEDVNDVQPTEDVSEAQESEAVNDVQLSEDGAWAAAAQVTLSEVRLYDTTVHIADIQIPDASYLRTAMANQTFGHNIKQTVAEMAEDNDALIAINGDYFGFRYSGYVIRGGVLYRDEIYDNAQEDLCIWPDGSMTTIMETDVSAQTLIEQGVREVLCFGPALVKDGQIQISETMEVGTYSDDNPRTAIAMIKPLHYLFVVSDGRTQQDKGLTLYQLAELLQGMGAQLVYNLDGGGSSTMVYEGEIVNFPTARGYREERRVSDIVYISR